MTLEQLEIGNAITARATRLRKILTLFEAAADSFDESFIRMTSFDLCYKHNGESDCFNINQGEIRFLIEALKGEISALERTLERL